MCNWRLKFSEPYLVVKINNFVKPETVRCNFAEHKTYRQLNMKFGKTIKIFLIDGEPNGRMSSC